jgi:hypothetical protein
VQDKRLSKQEPPEHPPIPRALKNVRDVRRERSRSLTDLRLKPRLMTALYLWRFFVHEFQHPGRISPGARISTVRKGFFSSSDAVYQLSGRDHTQYVSDFQIYVRARQLNHCHRILTWDKLIFNTFLGALPEQQVPIFAIVDRGRIRRLDYQMMSEKEFVDELDRREAIVIKPTTAMKGTGVTIVRRNGAGVTINGRQSSTADLVLALCGSKRQLLVSDLVRQHDVIAGIYPETTNTIRALTMWDGDEPFIAAAILRIGTASSRPVDNWGRGGLSAEIDLNTGSLSKAARYERATGHLDWLAAHPDTGVLIEGTAIPNWEMVSATVLRVARHFWCLPLAGWDAVVTEAGVKILEGNDWPGLRAIQVHRPLLRSERVHRALREIRVV